MGASARCAISTGHLFIFLDRLTRGAGEAASRPGLALLLLLAHALALAPIRWQLAAQHPSQVGLEMTPKEPRRTDAHAFDVRRARQPRPPCDKPYPLACPPLALVCLPLLPRLPVWGACVPPSAHGACRTRSEAALRGKGGEAAPAWGALLDELGQLREAFAVEVVLVCSACHCVRCTPPAPFAAPPTATTKRTTGVSIKSIRPSLAGPNICPAQSGMMV